MKEKIRAIKKITKSLASYAHLLKIFVGELVNIYRKKHLYKKVKFNKSQINEIQQYWQTFYGKKISTKWHRLYQSYTGKYRKDYFPEIIYSTKLEPKLNDRAISRILSDKSFLEIFYKDFDNVKIPETYLINNSGIFYTADRKIISEQVAIDYLKDIGEVIIKTSLGSSSGDDVKLCDFQQGIDLRSNKNVRTFFKQFEKDFIVQEKILPHESFKNIYPNSINTLRVITYLVNDKINHAPLSFRIGQGGNFVDNLHAGGLVVGVSNEGYLKEYAFTEMQSKFSHHPDTNIKFEGYRLDKVESILEISKSMHEKTPHMRMISWDFTLNHKNEIVLLEINLLGQSLWFPQMANGEAMFGKDTPHILGLLNKN